VDRGFSIKVFEAGEIKHLVTETMKVLILHRRSMSIATQMDWNKEMIAMFFTVQDAHKLVNYLQVKS